MPADTIPTSRLHSALSWLIRGTGASLAIGSMIAMVCFVGGMIIGAIRGETGTLGWIGAAIAILFVASFLGLVFKRGYNMFRKINAMTVADFSSVFALLLAMAWYHLLPPHLPQVIADFCARNAFLAPFSEQGRGLTYRGVFSFIAFFVFYKLIKAYLMQALDLNVPNPPSSDPDISEFPRKSPLVQL